MIRNFSRFVFGITKHKDRIFVCKRCFGHFRLESAFKQHQLLCTRENFTNMIYTMPPEGSSLKYKNIRYELMCPFIIIADSECYTQPINKRTAHTTYFQKHIPCAIGFKLVAPQFPELNEQPYEEYTGDDCVEWFLKRMIELEDQCMHRLFDEERLIMTRKDYEDFKNARECYICRKPLNDDKVYTLINICLLFVI